VCGAELEAQTGIAEKTLAEFIVDVAKGARNVDGFKKVSKNAQTCICLLRNGAGSASSALLMPCRGASSVQMVVLARLR
jgi:hypothetical protein